MPAIALLERHFSGLLPLFIQILQEHPRRPSYLLGWREGPDLFLRSKTWNDFKNLGSLRDEDALALAPGTIADSFLMDLEDSALKRKSV